MSKIDSGIWFREYALEDLNKRGQNTLVEHLNIVITEMGHNFLCGTMPVNHKTFQPAGILHGGASVALAETLGSIASNLIIDPEKQYAVGMEINANHLRPVSSGFVTGKASIIHLGAKSHIWSIEIFNEQNKLNCISRLTMAIIDR
jgi:1,4-dihydroxy-2-naphthoyl-CoA hydrolase